MGGIESQLNAPDMNSPQAKDIMATVSDHCVVIYSKTNCSFCRDTKNLFTKLQVPMKVIELDQRSDGELLQNILGHMTHSRTVPRVFVNGQCVGGARETQALHRRGQLVQLMSSCS